MIPRSSRPILAALRRLRDDGIDARLFCQVCAQVCARVEATASGPAMPGRTDAVKRAIRRAVVDPDMRVSVRFEGGSA